MVPETRVLASFLALTMFASPALAEAPSESEWALIEQVSQVERQYMEPYADHLVTSRIDLTGDGRPEAVMLLETPSTCSNGIPMCVLMVTDDSGAVLLDTTAQYLAFQRDEDGNTMVVAVYQTDADHETKDFYRWDGAALAKIGSAVRRIPVTE